MSVLWRYEESIIKLSNTFHFGTKQDCIAGVIIIIYALLWLLLLTYCVRLSKNRFEEIKRSEEIKRRRSTIVPLTVSSILRSNRLESLKSCYGELLI